jgi:small subunit ribosomal protein S1
MQLHLSSYSARIVLELCLADCVASYNKLTQYLFVLLLRYEGIVNNVVNYGCFVDIGAETNGLVHISQMADDFVTNTESIVKEGDTVKVKLISVDVDAQKVVLTMRSSPRKAHTQQAADVSKYAAVLASDPDAFLPGTVESIVSYGAFINLEEGTSGFLHISQLKPKTEHVTDPNEVLTVGQQVQVCTVTLLTMQSL